MKATRVIEGRKVTFITQVGATKDVPKLINVFVERGGFGPFQDWIDAMAGARAMVFYANTSTLIGAAETQEERDRLTAFLFAEKGRHDSEQVARDARRAQ